MPALVSAGPAAEVSASPALSQGPRRAGHRKVRQQCTEQTWGGRRSQIPPKTQSTSFLCTRIFQQFRTGSELVSGDQHCRWVFRQPTCKWVLAKIPQLTVFFFFFVRNAIFRYSQRNVAFCLLRAGVQMSTASSDECQVFENCHWVCELPNTISKLLQEAGFIFC